MKIESLVTKVEYDLAVSILRRAEENGQFIHNYYNERATKFNTDDFEKNTGFVEPVHIINGEHDAVKKAITRTRNSLLDLEIKKDGIQRFLEDT